MCTDTRGSDWSKLIKHYPNPEKVIEFWGSKEHWDLYAKSPNPKSCPRCTLKPHIQIYDQMAQRDNTTFEFI